ncbi:MAG TPA: hypothetical protein VFC47_10325, partial [Caulobacteraceae bacterium]|nr:hypothetical protein [Caulobacteraceae bacterium]
GLAPAAMPRLFGVSMVSDARTVQAEGYLAITPDGQGAQLRAGSGTLVLGAPPRVPRLLAVDFDAQGVVVVSGSAPPGAMVRVRIDSVERGAALADRAGRFSLAIEEPLAPGDHRVEIAAAGTSLAIDAAIVAPVAPAGPFSATRIAGGWRIDWLTPGGGRQTTLIFPPMKGAA